jgi:hypothetical protein
MQSKSTRCWAIEEPAVEPIEEPTVGPADMERLSHNRLPLGRELARFGGAANVVARCRSHCISGLIGLAATLGLVDSSFSQNAVPFTPLHTYYISPTGKDYNTGTSPGAAWATPHHAVNCGDVIIAAAGNYGELVFGTNSWGAVSNCPSKSGGIDGKGGIYFAVVLCAGPYVTSCSVNGEKYEAFRVDASNWAVEGFSATQYSTGNGACYSATSETNATLHHIAFINNIASNCNLAGFDTYSWTSPGGVDQTAVVGAISYNGAQSFAGGICGSGVSIIPTNGPDASPGTHVFVAGYFGYKNINAPIGAGCNTDGEGLIFDSWACSRYTRQGVAEQNVWWLNGNAGFEVFPNCRYNGDKAQIYVFHNTSYRNEQDPKHVGAGVDLLLNQVLPTTANGTYYSIYNNIFVTTEATSDNNFKTPVYGAGVYLNNSNVSLISVNGNYIWQSNPGTRTQAGNPNTDVYVNGSHNTTSFPFGTNTYSNPGFANPGGLPTTAPNCAGYTNTTACMNQRYRVAGNLTPSGGAAGKGYQPPGPCAADPFFPVWLKGVVFLRWNGSGLTENAGLITKPCNM